ncbi:MAG TPA: RDD family protein, partial [Nitrososphaeraceae archaeon]
IVLAKWLDRFTAWLIDFLIISIPLWLIFGIIDLYYLTFDDATQIDMGVFSLQGLQLQYFISSLIFLSYWTYFESTTGQSIGKKLLNIKTTTLDSKSLPTIKNALIESFGKSFLLPIDLVLGWFLTDRQRQRIFNRLSDTIVIKLKNKEMRLNDRYYIKD